MKQEKVSYDKLTSLDILQAIARSPQYIKDYNEMYAVYDPQKEQKFIKKYKNFEDLAVFPIDPYDCEGLRQLE